MTKDEKRAARRAIVLELVNKARVAAGQKPLRHLKRGVKTNPGKCVIARSLPNIQSVVGDYVVFADEETAKRVARAWHKRYSSINARLVWTPKVINQFVFDFDNGEYPNLAAKQ